MKRWGLLPDDYQGEGPWWASEIKLWLFALQEAADDAEDEEILSSEDESETELRLFARPDTADEPEDEDMFSDKDKGFSSDEDKDTLDSEDEKTLDSEGEYKFSGEDDNSPSCKDYESDQPELSYPGSVFPENQQWLEKPVSSEDSTLKIHAVGAQQEFTAHLPLKVDGGWRWRFKSVSEAREYLKDKKEECATLRRFLS